MPIVRFQYMGPSENRILSESGVPAVRVVVTTGTIDYEIPDMSDLPALQDTLGAAHLEHVPEPPAP